MREVVACSVIFLLASSGAAGTEMSSSQCSRSKSRIVRKLMDEHLWSRLYDSSIAMKLPESCPLNPNKELFYKQEKNKLCKHTGECSCQLCGKSFKNEFYMDKHLTLKHHDVVNHNATICLADFCPIFGCSYHRTKESTTRKRDVAIDDKKSFNVIEPCTEESLATRKHQCEQLLSS